MRSRRVVVTGAAGFVGAALVRRLIARGHEVLAWVRPGGSTERLAGIDVRSLAGDLAELRSSAGSSAVLETLRAFHPEVVVHAAWAGTRGPDRDDPSQVDNVERAMALVHLAAAAGAVRFVGIGSQAEYGPRSDVITEETLPEPTTLYGAAKLACGHLTLALARASGMSAAWARLFSVYGPGDRDGTLISEVIAACEEQRAVPVGDLEIRWDYLFEDDAGEALAALATSDHATGTFNVASGRAVALREVVARIAALASPHGGISLVRRPPAPTDLPRLEADTTRVRTTLAWEPETDLDAGLARTVAALRRRRRRIPAEG